MIGSNKFMYHDNRLKQWYASAAVGFAQAVAGHPLDTVKVILQNGERVSSTSVQTIMKRLMQGVTPPLITAGLSGTVLFGTEASVRNQLHWITSRYGMNDGNGINWGNHYISGMITGVITTPIISPLEQIKVRQQMGIPWKIKSVFNGMAITLARRIPSIGILFGVQHDLRKAGMSEFSAGVLSGIAMWLPVYPIDVIKSRIQTERMTVRQAIRYGNLWAGLTPCLARAGLVYGIGFKILEMTKC